MKSRVAVAIILIASALASWLFRLTSVPVPLNLLSTTSVLLGGLGLVSAFLLKMGLVKPSVVWGETPGGMALLGLGTMLLGFGSRQEQDSVATLELLVGAVALLTFTGGLLLERKAARVRKHP